VVQILLRKYFITKKEEEFDPVMSDLNIQRYRDLGSFIKVCSIQLKLMGALAAQIKEIPPGVYNARIVATIPNPRLSLCSRRWLRRPHRSSSSFLN
jgi:hypothetical protein